MALFLSTCIACSVIAIVVAVIISSYVKITIGGSGGPKVANHPSKNQEPAHVPEEPLPKNLLKNNCGQEGFQHWEILSSGANGWTVEKTPVGIEEVPVVSKEGIPISDFGGHLSCFATSYGLSEKLQVVDLVAEGLSPDTLDTTQPPIEVIEWFACRIVCDSIYMLTVKLLDENKECVCDFKRTEDFADSPKESWQKVSHTFKKYGPGVRYVWFCHGGGDSRKLPGHYGCKISGSVVKVSYAKNPM